MTSTSADWGTYTRRSVAESIYKALKARGVPFFDEKFTAYGSIQAGYADVPEWAKAFWSLEVDKTYASRHLPWTTFWRLVAEREDFRRATCLVFEEEKKRGRSAERLRSWVRKSRQHAQE